MVRDASSGTRTGGSPPPTGFWHKKATNTPRTRPSSMHPKSSVIGGLFLSLPFLPSCYCLLPQCKIMPGDSAWPDSAAWDHFNSSIDGRLIRTVPVASPCHGLDFNITVCDFVRNQWHHPPFQFVEFSINISFTLYFRQ